MNSGISKAALPGWKYMTTTPIIELESQISEALVKASSASFSQAVCQLSSFKKPIDSASADAEQAWIELWDKNDLLGKRPCNIRLHNLP